MKAKIEIRHFYFHFIFVELIVMLHSGRTVSQRPDSESNIALLSVK